MSDIESLAREYMVQKPAPQYGSANQPEGPKSGWKTKLLALFVGVIFAFILAEVGLRLLGYNAAENKKTTDVSTGLRVFEANASIPFRESCLSNTIVTNGLGFHAKDYPVEKPADTYRIVIVGDSFVEASQVSVEETFPYLLEEKLNSKKGGKKYEVIALGISGNATYANYQYLRAYGLQFKPDLVLNAFFSNDVLADTWRPDNPSLVAPIDDQGRLDTTRAVAELSLKDKGFNFIKKIVKRSNVVLILYSQYQSWQVQKNTGPEVPEAIEGEKVVSIDNQLYLREIPDIYKQAWIVQEALMKEFKEISEENNAKFLLVSLPEAARTHDNLRKEFLLQFPDPSSVDLDIIEKRLADITRRNQIQYLALQKPFTQRAISDSASTVWPCDGHFNGTGHRWTAEMIYDFLTKNNLL